MHDSELGPRWIIFLQVLLGVYTHKALFENFISEQKYWFSAVILPSPNRTQHLSRCWTSFVTWCSHWKRQTLIGTLRHSDIHASASIFHWTWFRPFCSAAHSTYIGELAAASEAPTSVLNAVSLRELFLYYSHCWRFEAKGFPVWRRNNDNTNNNHLYLMKLFPPLQCFKHHKVFSTVHAP